MSRLQGGIPLNEHVQVAAVENILCQLPLRVPLDLEDNAEGIMVATAAAQVPAASQ